VNAYLLDTCTFLWLVADSPQLPKSVRSLFSSPDNSIYLSVVSVWEILVKTATGALTLPEPAHEYVTRQRVAHRIDSLPLNEDAVVNLPRLPSVHKDPFDRMLICQALASGFTILTPDREISSYPVKVAW
jgi:PIN domain nuclease of toxin-antitoxin system